MTNQSFRERLGLSDEKAGVDITSKVIRETVADKMIRLNDTEKKAFAKILANLKSSGAIILNRW